MPKRNLRIVRRVRSIPALGICERCNAQFAGDPDRGNSQSDIQSQFNAHAGKPLDDSQNAQPGRQATENK